MVPGALLDRPHGADLGLRANARLEQVRRSRDGWLLTLADGRTLRAPLVVAADGEERRLSRQFADGKAAGAVTKQLQSGQTLDIRSEAYGFNVWLDGECVAESTAIYADAAERDAGIAALRVALTPIED